MMNVEMEVCREDSFYLVLPFGILRSYPGVFSLENPDPFL